MRWYPYNYRANISDLVGSVLTKIDCGNSEIDFFTADGDRYAMYHDQDCCESVYLEDVIGDLDDLLDSPLLMAECITEDHSHEKDKDGYTMDSCTWTFYKFATIKGYVTLRWVGESNGYYSEEVDFAKVPKGENI